MTSAPSSNSQPYLRGLPKCFTKSRIKRRRMYTASTLLMPKTAGSGSKNYPDSAIKSRQKERDQKLRFPSYLPVRRKHRGISYILWPSCIIAEDPIAEAPLVINYYHLHSILMLSHCLFIHLFYQHIPILLRVWIVGIFIFVPFRSRISLE